MSESESECKNVCVCVCVCLCVCVCVCVERERERERERGRASNKVCEGGVCVLCMCIGEGKRVSGRWIQRWRVRVVCMRMRECESSGGGVWKRCAREVVMVLACARCLGLSLGSGFVLRVRRGLGAGERPVLVARPVLAGT